MSAIGAGGPLTTLPGWDSDDHAAALAAFVLSADQFDPAMAEVAREADDPRAFFEAQFQPAPFSAEAGLLTGYYEPELDGARERGDGFEVPVLGLPAGDGPLPDRAAIEAGALDGAAPVLCWLPHMVDLFFLQVQGSGRVRFSDGTVLRLGFAGRNGHPYRSIGQTLIARGVLEETRISADAVRQWIHANPEPGRALMHENPSYVFFAPLDLPAESGPLGAMGVPVTPMRSIAVDPVHMTLGRPIWMVAQGHAPRLVIAQDSGSAIKGVHRADLFHGSGAEAGLRAGALKTPVHLMPLRRRRGA